MDPGRVCSYLHADRLPRTRGDGPPPRASLVCVTAAPPHARGWTLRGCCRHSPRRGSPARAGMDPRRLAVRGTCTRLPRTRGDGPLAKRRDTPPKRAPPHARGWTPNDVVRQLCAWGSPARAGMDPPPPSAWPSRLGLPRTRGDGPATKREAMSHRTAPPHARGWTRHEERSHESPHGSPARAGMDPRRAARWAAARGLPRTRGDGPKLLSDYRPLVQAPPHARGWTLARAVGLEGSIGSPARAGMDPTGPARRIRRRRLPRTRGDGPPVDLRMALTPRAPPHARGWTPESPQLRGPGLGSPARAGMDPRSNEEIRDSVWLPRTRGDGPERGPYTFLLYKAPPHARGWTQADRPQHVAARGSPARAGMDPGSCWPWASLARLPRTRGDGPRLTSGTITAGWAPPHARGWTISASGGGVHVEGSPARAGMDPRGPRRSRSCRRLPRTRGDGPWKDVAAALRFSAPPHARGDARATPALDLPRAHAWRALGAGAPSSGRSGACRLPAAGSLPAPQARASEVPESATPSPWTAPSPWRPQPGSQPCPRR